MSEEKMTAESLKTTGTEDLKWIEAAYHEMALNATNDYDRTEAIAGRKMVQRELASRGI